MNIKLVTDERIAETSSKGNQEKWCENNIWYKLDQFGYESLAETLISKLLEQSNIESDTPFRFVRYDITKVIAHGLERVCCTSSNFLKQNQEIITLNRLLTSEEGKPLKKVLGELKSDVQRIKYLAEKTAEITGLTQFGKYLSVLFEIDALFLNTDRHLNNIAVLYENGKFDYCPIFDNGAGLLSDMVTMRTDIEPLAFIESSVSSPFKMSFTRQVSTSRRLFGSLFHLPELSKEAIFTEHKPLLEFYPQRDRGIISDRVIACIVEMQRRLKRIYPDAT